MPFIFTICATCSIDLITDETIEFDDSLELYYTFSTKQQRNLSKTFTIDSFRPPNTTYIDYVMIRLHVSTMK
jgi:hypothetical protein